MNRVFTAGTDVGTARAYWTMSRGDSARAFRAARGHSRLVRFLRIALPIAVLLAVVAVIVITYFNPLRMLGKLPIDISNLVVHGSTFIMQQPRMTGFTRDSRPYELTADAAQQDLTKPDIIEMRNIRGKLQMQDNSTMILSAATGVYNSKVETIKLERDIQLDSTTGYQGNLSEATVDIRTGHVVSEHPVKVKLLQGTLDANRLEIVNSGDLVTFDGGVSMTLMLNGASLAAPTDAAPANGAPAQ